VEVYVDRKQIDKAIKEMKLFKATKQAVADYKKSVTLLEEREIVLRDELVKLQHQHIKLLLDQQDITDASEIIYMRKQSKEISDDMRVIQSLLEEVCEEKKALKISHALSFRTALLDDRKEVEKYNINHMVNNVRYELLKSIADLSQAMTNQYEEISSDIGEVLSDGNVMAAHPRIEYVAHSDNFLPTYGESMPNVITKNDIFAARSKQINYPDPKKIKK
jgi:hypothetical protein